MKNLVGKEDLVEFFVCLFASLVPALVVARVTPTKKQKNEELQTLLDHHVNAQQADPGQGTPGLSSEGTSLEVREMMTKKWQ